MLRILSSAWMAAKILKEADTRPTSSSASQPVLVTEHYLRCELSGVEGSFVLRGSNLKLVYRHVSLPGALVKELASHGNCDQLMLAEMK